MSNHDSICVMRCLLWNMERQWSNIVSDILYGAEYSDCCDLDTCYLFQFASTRGDCEYYIDMNGVATNGSFEYDPSFIPDEIIFAGNCANYLDEDLKLYVFTYPRATSDVAYTFYRIGQSAERGLIQEGNYDFFKMNESDYNIFAYNSIGYINYYVVKD